MTNAIAGAGGGHGINWVDGRLAQYIADELPRTATGKVQKNVLRRQYACDEARA